MYEERETLEPASLSILAMRSSERVRDVLVFILPLYYRSRILATSCWHWRIGQEVAPNFLASSSKLRPAQCSATFWRRNSGVYLGCDFAIWLPFFREHDVSTKPGQVHYHTFDVTCGRRCLLHLEDEARRVPTAFPERALRWVALYIVAAALPGCGGGGGSPSPALSTAWPRAPA
jgi:hypothetical protein